MSSSRHPLKPFVGFLKKVPDASNKHLDMRSMGIDFVGVFQCTSPRPQPLGPLEPLASPWAPCPGLPVITAASWRSKGGGWRAGMEFPRHFSDVHFQGVHSVKSSWLRGWHGKNIHLDGQTGGVPWWFSRKDVSALEPSNKGRF